jgi:nitrogen regulatory protein P-II 1
MKEIIAILRPQQLQATQELLFEKGIDFIAVYDALGRGREAGMATMTGSLEGSVSRVPFLKKRMISFLCPIKKVRECLEAIVDANQTGRVGDGKIFVSPVEVVR